jgi:hypothetical protein
LSKIISKDPIKMTFFKQFPMSANLGNFREGYYGLGITVFPQNASMAG